MIPSESLVSNTKDQGLSKLKVEGKTLKKKFQCLARFLMGAVGFAYLFGDTGSQNDLTIEIESCDPAFGKHGRVTSLKLQ